LGAALVLKDDGHIRVDLILNHLSGPKRAWADVLSSLVGGIVMLLYTWFGAQVTLEAIGRGTPALESLRTPMFLIWMIIPIGSFFFTVQFFRQMADAYRKLKR